MRSKCPPHRGNAGCNKFRLWWSNFKKKHHHLVQIIDVLGNVGLIVAALSLIFGGGLAGYFLSIYKLSDDIYEYFGQYGYVPLIVVAFLGWAFTLYYMLKWQAAILQLRKATAAAQLALQTSSQKLRKAEAQAEANQRAILTLEASGVNTITKLHEISIRFTSSRDTMPFVTKIYLISFYQISLPFRFPWHLSPHRCTALMKILIDSSTLHGRYSSVTQVCRAPFASSMSATPSLPIPLIYMTFG
jgi:hypothetical protein